MKHNRKQTRRAKQGAALLQIPVCAGTPVHMMMCCPICAPREQLPQPPDPPDPTKGVVLSAPRGHHQPCPPAKSSRIIKSFAAKGVHCRAF